MFFTETFRSFTRWWSTIPTKDDPRITVRLSQEQYDTYVTLAKLRGLSLSAFVRELLSTVSVTYPIHVKKP